LLHPVQSEFRSLVIRVEPRVVFGFDEHAENFAESATRWAFDAG